ncbi:hypothetical protein [Mesorhizobium sp. M0589]|uniref:hypothetical protein n=1 Tax=Mesorhizobium sp. M0589 TaxID=2956965 RepID=UPI00333AB425
MSVQPCNKLHDAREPGQSMLRTAALDHYYNTVWCVVASPFVTEYMIGYTRRPGMMRLNEYWHMHGYQYLVILANGLSLMDAAKLEKYLQEQIWASKKSGVLYRKYNSDRRQGRHFASAGPLSTITDTDSHSVYLAWWDGKSEYI